MKFNSRRRQSFEWTRDWDVDSNVDAPMPSVVQLLAEFMEGLQAVMAALQASLVCIIAELLDVGNPSNPNVTIYCYRSCCK